VIRQPAIGGLLEVKGRERMGKGWRSQVEAKRQKKRDLFEKNALQKVTGKGGCTYCEIEKNRGWPSCSHVERMSRGTRATAGLELEEKWPGPWPARAILVRIARARGPRMFQQALAVDHELAHTKGWASIWRT